MGLVTALKVWVELTYSLSKPNPYNYNCRGRLATTGDVALAIHHRVVFHESLKTCGRRPRLLIQAKSYWVCDRLKPPIDETKARFILLTPSVSDKYCRRRLPPRQLPPSLSRADQTKKYERSSVVADSCQRMS